VKRQTDALIEFAHPSFCHGWLIPSVDFRNVISFDALYLGVHCEPSCKGDCEVIAKRAELAALVREVIDEFAVFTIFA